MGEKVGSGSIFVNEKKASENHPDFRGSIVVNGQKLWVSGWKKSYDKGKYISLSISSPDDIINPKPDHTKSMSDFDTDF
jgi:uncharacterized protein (DUF736 family)